MSLTGTRPTVGLIYVGLAKAIAGTPTAIALLDKLADENQTLRMEITRLTAEPTEPTDPSVSVSERAGMGPNSGEVYL